MKGHHYIDGLWVQGVGTHYTWADPATGQVVWEGRDATPEDIDKAVAAARRALPDWAGRPREYRVAAMERFGQQLLQHKETLAQTICHNTGKPRWEARAEVDSMIAKIALSNQAYDQRRTETSTTQDGITACTRFKPHGVVAVLGPFNMPGHLPNGHIVPALLAGNTVVFKPSDLAPGVGEQIIELWQSAQLPNGVINLVQGGHETGAALAAHAGIDGLFFTGSYAVGQAIHHALADHPEKILALEMGGNSPLVVADVAQCDAAVYAIIQSAFITSGQRCSCARRLIVVASAQTKLIVEQLAAAIPRIRVSAFTADPEPFMGPVISATVADNLLEVQNKFVSLGGLAIVPMQRLSACAAMLSAGLIDTTDVAVRPDAEIFGPLLQLIRVPDFAAAILEANRTQYGLAAGLLSDSRELYERFYRDIRAGVVYWNRPTTGASGSLPFGGIGNSGNHRPSGFYAADYCSYPVASMESPSLALPTKLTPGIQL